MLPLPSTVRHGLALGIVLRRHPAFDCNRTAALSEVLARAGKIAAGWALATLAAVFGASTALAAFVYAALAEYMSFIILLFTLYVVAGGIVISGSLRATPLVNAGILAFGTAIASIVGTTGAAMILVRPLIRANAARRQNAHVVVFFIILVANIGGALSPLGDPPLLVGFLRGVDFFWTTKHLFSRPY